MSDAASLAPIPCALRGVGIEDGFGEGLKTGEISVRVPVFVSSL